MKKVLFFIVLLFFSFHSKSFCSEKFVVVIDAGHGGKDGGAVRGNYKEKDINLGVALALGKLIEANMNDVKVVYTRKSDTFVDLYKRADIANKAKANLFISIHTNSTAAKSTTASGADTYILGLARSEENLAVAKRENSVILLEDNYNKRYEGFDPNSPESNIIFEFMTDKYMEQSLQFATQVQSGFSKVAKRVDRGVLQAGFLVLRESGMPSVLIELGFINNPAEAKYLSSAIGQRTMASAIYSGLDRYKKDFDKKQSRTISVTEVSSKNNTKTVNNKKEEEVLARNDTPDSVVTSSPTEAPKRTFIQKNNDVNAVSNSKQTNKKEQNQNMAVANKSNQTKEPTNKTQQKEPKKQEKQPTDNLPSVSKKIPAGAIEYRVQFLTSSKKLVNNSPAFKGLSPVSSYVDGGVIKYTYGSTTSDAEASRLLKQAKTKFNDAFIVKFRDNARIK